MATKLSISLSASKPEEVLKAIAKTIRSRNPGHENDTYTADNCYGRVAWFLRKPEHWKPKDYIMLFSLNGRDVDHCCIYDEHGKIVVDTFEGKPIKKGWVIYYQMKNGHEYKEMSSIRLDVFKKKYL